MSKPLYETVVKFLAIPRAALVIAAASFGALAFAFVMQYGFNYHPCILCLWQRVPFVIAGVLAIIAPIGKFSRRCAHLLFGICAIAFLVNTGIAIFHTGVERHWWEGTRGCSITPLHAKTVEGWREELMHMAVGHCDVISWTFLGLSMTNWNIPFSFGLALFSFAAACQNCRRKL